MLTNTELLTNSELLELAKSCAEEYKNRPAGSGLIVRELIRGYVGYKALRNILYLNILQLQDISCELKNDVGMPSVHIGQMIETIERALKGL